MCLGYGPSQTAVYLARRKNNNNVLQKAVSKRHNQIQSNEKFRDRNVHFHIFFPDRELTQPVFCLFAVGFVSQSLLYRESGLQQIGKMHSFYTPKSQMQGLNRHSILYLP